MTRFWELKAFLAIVGGILFLAGLSVGKAWMDRRRKWKAIPRHFGSTYDASVRLDHRPNVRMIRQMGRPS